MILWTIYVLYDNWDDVTFDRPIEIAAIVATFLIAAVADASFVFMAYALYLILI